MNPNKISGGLKTWIVKLPLLFKILIPCAILGLGYFGYTKIFVKTTKVTYQTATAQKGTLISNTQASGTITSGNTTYITTGATGTVSKVYVKNGDTVVKNQKLADLTLDDLGQQTQTTAWNNYQQALVNVKVAQTQKDAANILVFQKQQAMTDAQNADRDAHSGGWNPQTVAPYTPNQLSILDEQYPQAVDAYAQAEKAYAISDTNIALANAKAQAAYTNYQQVSSSIYAPVSGVLSNLILAPGVVISNSSNNSITVSSGTDTTSNSVSVSSQNIGSIKNPAGQYQATVTLTEVDVTNVHSGQKASLTLTAYPDATLTGTVLAVNTSGNVSQGVTSYSAIILLDNTDFNLYTNMSVNATIILNSKTDVLLIPSTAIQTATDGSSYVQVQKNGQISNVTVVTGDSDDTQTEITSGLNEGDVVVTGTVSSTAKSAASSTTTRSTTGSTSLFGGTGGGFGGGAAGFLRGN